MGVVCEMVQQMGDDFASFLPGFQDEVRYNHLSSPLFDVLTANLGDAKRSLNKQQSTPPVLSGPQDSETHARLRQQCLRDSDEAALEAALVYPHRGHTEEWVTWRQLLTLELLKQSPDHTLYSCVGLLQVISMRYFQV